MFKRNALLFAAGATIAGLLAVEAAPVAKAAAPDLERGRYLTFAAGQCDDCHGGKLQGGPLGFLKPGLPVQYSAPEISGMPKGWSRAQTARFLETGKTPSGGQARPPMPQYRFSHADAEAIAAYLESRPSVASR